MANPYASPFYGIKADMWEKAWIKQDALIRGKCRCNQCISNGRAIHHGQRQ